MCDGQPAQSGDRAAIGNIVYDALRRKRSAGWLFDAETPRALGFGGGGAPEGDAGLRERLRVEMQRIAAALRTAG